MNKTKNQFVKGFEYAEKYHSASLKKLPDSEIENMINVFMKDYRENGNYNAAGMAEYYRKYLKQRRAVE